MFGKKKTEDNKQSINAFGGKNESDKTPVIEPTYYYLITYKTELQIVLRDNQVICSDFVHVIISPTEDHDDPVQIFIEESYKNGHMKTRGKKDEFITHIATADIKKILYKPTYTIEKKKDSK